MMLLQLTADEMMFVVVVQFNHGVTKSAARCDSRASVAATPIRTREKKVVGRAAVHHQLYLAIGKGCIWYIFRHCSHHYRL